MVLLFSYSEQIFCEVRAVEKQGFLEGEPNYWWLYLLGKQAKKKGFLVDNVFDVQSIETYGFPENEYIY